MRRHALYAVALCEGLRIVKISLGGLSVKIVDMPRAYNKVTEYEFVVIYFNF